MANEWTNVLVLGLTWTLQPFQQVCMVVVAVLIALRLGWLRAGGGHHPAEEALLGEIAVQPIAAGAGLVHKHQLSALRAELADELFEGPAGRLDHGESGAKPTLEALLERWRGEGLPTYAQFDNDTIFQGAHQFVDPVGRISRLCLALQVIPVFAPPREPGFQNAIEGFNALWQSKVWQRHHCPDVERLKAVSQRSIAAYRAKTAPRRESGPSRRPFPSRFHLDLCHVHVKKLFGCR
jgi:hypothetical protein